MRAWMQGNRPVGMGAAPMSVQITSWGMPIATMLQSMSRQQNLMTSGLGLLENHPNYNDASYWRSMWGIGVFTSMLVGGFMGAYHGRKRSGGKFGSTLGYGLAGAVAPLPTLGVSVIQGFGKRKGR